MAKLVTEQQQVNGHLDRLSVSIKDVPFGISTEVIEGDLFVYDNYDRAQVNGLSLIGELSRLDIDDMPQGEVMSPQEYMIEMVWDAINTNEKR